MELRSTGANGGNGLRTPGGAVRILDVDAVERDRRAERRALDEVVVEPWERPNEEDAVAAAHGGRMLALRGLPGETEARREVVPVVVHPALGEAGVAREDRARGRILEPLRLVSGAIARHLAEHVVIRKERVPAHAQA